MLTMRVSSRGRLPDGEHRCRPAINNADEPVGEVLEKTEGADLRLVMGCSGCGYKRCCRILQRRWRTRQRRRASAVKGLLAVTAKGSGATGLCGDGDTEAECKSGRALGTVWTRVVEPAGGFRTTRLMWASGQMTMLLP